MKPRQFKFFFFLLLQFFAMALTGALSLPPGKTARDFKKLLDRRPTDLRASFQISISEMVVIKEQTYIDEK